MWALGQIILGILAPGLVVSSIYNEMSKHKIINHSISNTIIAATISILISLSYISFAVLSWQSLYCTVVKCDVGAVAVVQPGNTLNGIINSKIHQNGLLNQSNTGNNNSAHVEFK